MAPITLEKISKVIFSTIPLKKTGSDTILALILQKIWPIAKHVIVCLFTIFIKLEVMLDQ